MKTLTTLFFILITLSSFGQRDTTWIPFRIALVDNIDTLSSGFDFYLTSENKEFRPTVNDSLQCFQFTNVDSIADFNIRYKNNTYTFKHIETVRLMYDANWVVKLDTLTTEYFCYVIIANQAGCFVNVSVGLYFNPPCEHKHHIWLTSFLPKQEGFKYFTEPIKTKKSRLRKKYKTYR